MATYDSNGTLSWSQVLNNLRTQIGTIDTSKQYVLKQIIKASQDAYIYRSYAVGNTYIYFTNAYIYNKNAWTLEFIISSVCAAQRLVSAQTGITWTDLTNNTVDSEYLIQIEIC